MFAPETGEINQDTLVSAKISIPVEWNTLLWPKIGPIPSSIMRFLLIYICIAVEGRRPERADGQQAEVRVRPPARAGAEQPGGENGAGIRQRQESGGRHPCPG